MMKRTILFSLLACGLLGEVRGEAPYTMGVLPDIQYYYNNYQSGNYAKLIAQIRWLGLNAGGENVRAALQLGDITQNDNNDSQWTGAKGAFDLLSGVVPYVLAVGNHDGVNDGRDSYFNLPKYFGPGSNYCAQPSFGASMEADDPANSYHFIDTGERTWLVVTLEWGPRDRVLEWLDALLSESPQYRTIVLTHAYLYMDNARLDATLFGEDPYGGNPKSYPAVADDPAGCNDGQDIWRKVLKKHPQVALVYSGHVGHVGIGRRASIGECRQLVQERLTDFQNWTGGGNGWMQTLVFSADGSAARTRSFSPYAGETSGDPDLDYLTPFFDDVLPAGRAAAEAELAPSYSFHLAGWSALRPVRNRAASKDGYALGASRRSGFCHNFGYGDTVAGSIPVRSAKWSFAAWVRFDESVMDGSASAQILRLGSLEVRAERSGKERLLTLASPGGTLVRDRFGLLAKRWYYVAASCGGETLDLYLDGEFLGSAEWTGEMDPVAGLVIGSASFRGQVHDFAFFDRALSMSELQRLRLASFTEVQAGQVGEAATSEMSLPGLSLDSRGTGRTIVRRSERSYIRYGSDGAYDGLVAIDDPLEYSDGVLLATPAQGAMQGDLLPAVGIPRTFTQTGIPGLGLRSGFSFAVTNTGSQSGVAVDAAFAYAFFPTCCGFVMGHVGADGTLIEETGLPADSAAPTGIQGSIRIGAEGFDARNGLLFAVAGTGESLIVNTGFDAAGNAFLYPLGTYRDRSNQAAIAPCSFVWIPGDAPNLFGGIYDGANAGVLKSYGDAEVLREGRGVYKITLARDPGAASLLLTSVDTSATGVYGETADNLLCYEDLGDGSYRVYCYDLPGRELEDTVFAWAAIPDEGAFGGDELDAADRSLLECVPDADLIYDEWHLSRAWGWLYARQWPWVWSCEHGWMYFWPADNRGGCWVYLYETGEWYGIAPAAWPWLYSPRAGWIRGLPRK
jgi:hypothetical protein